MCVQHSGSRPFTQIIDIIDYVHGIGNMMTSPIDSNTFHGGTTGAIRVAWLCGPLLESV